MLRVQDIGELAYGGAVTAAGWWDGKRITEAKITQKDVLKKAGFWAYWGIGLLSTLAAQFGWFIRYQSWMEHISHGFIYDVPRQVYNLIQSQKDTPAYIAGDAADAVREARDIVRAAEAARNARVRTGYEVVGPGEILV